MNETIVLLDEDDNEIELKVSATFGLDESEYAVLFPIDDEDGEAYILRIEYDDNGNMILLRIEDEDELEDAIFTYEAFVKEDNE